MLGALFAAAGGALAGCGESNDKVEYSQNFAAPEGVKAAPDPNAGKTRSEIRREEIEDSKKAPTGKKRRN